MEKQSKYSKIVNLVAIIYTFCVLIAFMISFVLLLSKYLNIFTFITSSLSWAISLILLWSLDYALHKIDVLENELIKRKLISSDIIEKLDETNKKHCSICNYSTTLDLSTCPKCGNLLMGTNVNIKNSNEYVQPTYKGKIVKDDFILCKNCGYQLFEEDTECPICKTKK